MNAAATALKSFTNKMVGALLVIAALTIGGYVGNFTNTTAPANASTPDPTSVCTGLMCADTITGQGGTVPTTGR